MRFAIFSFWCFSISCCLRLLIASHYSMRGVFNIMMRPSTSWPGMACNVVGYILRTSKALADIIPDQGSSLYRWLFFKSNVCTRFSITWWILSNIEFYWGFAVVAHLALIPYSVFIRLLLNAWPRNSFPQLCVIIVVLWYLHRQVFSTKFSIVASRLSLYCIISNHWLMGLP